MECRRLRGDVIEMAKIMDKMKAQSLSRVDDSKTIEHGLKVRGKRFESDLRSNLLLHVVYLEYTVRESYKTAGIMIFKIYLNRYSV